jgi:chromate reductase, NAD(P)H dehydrogenase (quinone)
MGGDRVGRGSRDVVALVGSLRADSWNRRLMVLAGELAPPSLRLSIVGVADVPLFDEDLEHNPPPGVVALDARLRRADGVVVACPEYNLGLAGVAKNTLDWLSRPVLEGPFLFMPCAVVCASTSRGEPVRATAQARTTLDACGASVMPPPDLAIRSISRRVDDDGHFTEVITDPLTEFLERFASFLDAFVAPAG